MSKNNLKFIHLNLKNTNMKTKILFIALASFVIVLGSFSYFSNSSKAVASSKGSVTYVCPADSAAKCCKKGEKHACKSDSTTCKKGEKKQCCKKGSEKKCCKKEVKK
jgi:hypothetical protein